MNYIPRILEKRIKEWLFKEKVIILYGARQVGKTTLAQKILAEFGENGKYLNCELASVEAGLSTLEAEKIKSFLGNYKIIVLDEAQNIRNIGKVLKIIVDTYPKMQIIATGSSSFDLFQKISEPLTGRNFQFTLYPLSADEIKESKDLFYLESKLENLLRFGGYPGVFGLSEDGAKERLNEISANYLYKDVLKFEGLKKSTVIKDLLRALALQVGQEVSYQELSAKLGINRLTVQKYMDILEQAFIVFKLHSFSRNKRKEISKSVKVYFHDLGIRNSLIENYNPLEIRNDAGFLWENFCMIERKKYNEYNMNFANMNFWRTYDQKEIDLIEEREGKLFAYEFKWNDKKTKIPKSFLADYSDSEFKVIDKSNYWQFLSSKN